MFESFENLYFYLNRHHTAEHKQRGSQSCICLRFQKGKIRSQQNKQKSGSAACVLQLPGKPLYSAFPKAKYYIFKCEPDPGGSARSYALYKSKQIIHMI